MNKLLEHIKLTMRYFCVITVSVMVASASYVMLFYDADAYISVNMIWQILITSFSCAQCTWCFYNMDERKVSKGQYLLRKVICYVYVNAVVLGLGVVFKWFVPSNIQMVIGMLVAIMLVFIVVTVYTYMTDLKTSNTINEKLRERNGE